MKVKAGDKFGKLTIKCLHEDGKWDTRTWLCICECGNETIVKERLLKDGHRKSCGCLRGKHMITHGETKTRLFKIWSAMNERCERKAHVHYKDYGGRGITVCDEWKEFISFRDWSLKNGYAENLSLDRKDVDGNYEPSNCRWVTMKVQHNNKRNNHKLEYKSEIHTISEWSEITGIRKTTIRERIKCGWSVEDALTKPVRKRKGADMRGGKND